MFGSILPFRPLFAGAQQSDVGKFMAETVRVPYSGKRVPRGLQIIWVENDTFLG